MNTRMIIAGLSLSAAGLVGLVGYEGYRDKAYDDGVGVPTIGFGTTEGVKYGDKIDVPQALDRALRDVTKFEGAIKRCVKVPLAQYEYDAYVSLSYNIGATAFCNSTLVRKLNAEDYEGACKEILRWNRAGGREMRGLTIRREKEYKLCMGEVR